MAEGDFSFEVAVGGGVVDVVLEVWGGWELDFSLSRGSFSEHRHHFFQLRKGPV